MEKNMDPQGILQPRESHKLMVEQPEVKYGLITGGSRLFGRVISQSPEQISWLKGTHLIARAQPALGFRTVFKLFLLKSQH